MGKELEVQHAENMRELGGYQTQDGREVAQRKLIRAATLNLLDDEDTDYLADYGLRKIVDFRSPREREEQPDQTVPTAENIALPIFPVEEKKVSASPFEVMNKMKEGYSAHEQMMDVYRNFITMPHIHKQYNQFFGILLENEKPEESVLFHCTAGKDRTGFGAAMMLSALGVNRATIFEDYLKTNYYLAKKTEEIRQQARQAGVTEEMLYGINDMMTAKQEYLQTSFNLISEQYGDVDQYLRVGIGLSKQDIKDLRQLYLV